MNTVASAFTVAALLGLAATPVVREAAARAGVARADATRATRRIPRLGGLAIAFAFYAAALCHAAGPRDPLLIAALAGGVPILLLGAYDDFRGADAGTKLLVQVAVALALYAAGLRIEAISLPNDATLGLGQLGLPVTVLWIVGITNAFNLLDGLDGLAAGVGVVAAAALCAVASLAGDIVTAVAMAALSGALVSFLVFNFHPASVFMGDTGSLFIGYIIAVTSLSLCTNDVGAAYPLTPALALGLPLLDTMTALGRRLLRGQHPFQGDREHLHHRLLDSGLDHRAAVLLLYLVAAGLGLFAVVSALGAGPLDALALAGGIGCLVALLRRLHGSRMQASSSRGSLLSRAER